MAALSNFQKMEVTGVRQSGDFDVDCISTACRLAGFIATNNQWSAQAVAALSQLIVNQPLKGAILGVVDNVTLVSLQSDRPVTVSISQQLVERGHGQFTALPLPLSEGHMATAYVSYSDSLDSFWLQFEEASLDDIAVKLEKSFLDSQTAPLALAALYQGTLCVTRFKEDGALYRAQILSASETRVKVLFVDYGNTQICEPVELFPIPASLAAAPGQAIHCSLAVAMQPKPVIWSEAESKKFAELVQDIPLTAQFESLQKGITHGELKWVVSLTSVESGTSIANSVTGIGGRGSSHVGGSKDAFGHTLPLLDIPVNTPVDVLISYVESPAVVWLQLSKQYASLTAMMVKLADHCSSASLVCSGSKDVEMKQGSLCAAQFSEDGVWYRARVVQAKPNVVVRFIDYGNTETKGSTAELLALPLQFNSLPAQAVSCSLANYSPCGLDPVAATRQLEKYLEQQLVASFLTAPQVGAGLQHCSVQLFDTVGDKDRDIGKMLSQGDTGTKNLEIKPATLPSSVTPAYVTTVVSPSQIYIQLLKWEAELTSLLDSMYAYYATSRALPLTTVQLGAICAAPFSVDGSWYRAKVVSVKQDTASVIFIDYGNSEEISCDQLMPLCPEFSTLPAQAIQCALFVGAGGGVTWASTAANIITSYTADKEVLVTPTAKMEGNSPLVRIAIGGQDLGEVLMKEGVAKLQHSIVKDSPRSQIAVPFPVLRPGSIHKCIILEWKSNQSFSCQFSDSISDLETLSNDIYSLYSSDRAPPKIASAQPGDFTCCQFTEDDSWYRARVMSKCGMGSGSFEVLYLDYGNREMLPVSRMRELVDRVCQLPAQSIECFAAAVPHGVSPSDEELFVRILQQTGERSYSVEVVQPGEEDGKLLPGLGDQGEFVFSFAVDNVEENSFIDVQVAHIVSPNLFYCIEPQAAAKLEDLLSQLTEAVPSLVPCSALTVGQACVAMFSQDECHYRGRIVSIDHSQSTAKVFFVDYGNSDVVPFSDIYSLPDKFRDAFPCQAIPCCLDCTSEPSDGWTDAATAAFEDLVMEEMFVAEIREKKQMQGGESIVVVELLDGDILVRNRFEEVLSMAAEHSSKAEPSAALSLMPYPPLDIDPCKSFQAVVTHISNPSSFYVQPLSVEEALVSINKNIDALLMGGRTSEIPVRDLHEGAPCLAKYSFDQQWYRGVIEGRNAQRWKVRFVDYGNSEEISSQSDLTRLSPELLASPVLAMHCGLQGIAPSLGSKGWSRHTVSAFKEILLDKEVSITITKTTKDAYHLVLLRMDNGEDVGDCLVRSGFTSRLDADNGSSSTQTSQGPSEDLYLSTTSSHLDSNSSAQPSSRHSSDAGDVAMVTKTPPTSFTYPIPPGVDTRMQVMVVFATSPVDFFCQDLQTSQRLNEVMEKLAQCCPTAPSVSSVAVGQPCAALYSEDESWYRAEIVEVTTGSQALVQFVDYGNSEVVDLSSIVTLPSDLTSLPAQAFWCSLYNDFERQYSESEAAAFVTKVTEQSFELEVKEVEGDSLIVSLKDSSGVAVTDTSCETEGGGDTQATAVSSSVTLLPVEAHCGSFARTPLLAGAKLSVVVTFVNSPADFFCQDASNCDALDEVMASLETYCADSTLTTGVAWGVGDVCAALYSVDEGWYRAEVIDRTADGHVTVQYVDYGNIETVESSALQPLAAEHLTLPAQAIWCSVTDDFELQFSDEHIEAFKTAISDQDCSLTVKKCEGDSVIVELRDPTGQVFDESYFKDDTPSGHEGTLGAEKACLILPPGENVCGSPLYFTYPSPPPVGERLQVLVTHVTSPGDFFCQDLTKSEDLGQLMDGLATHCSKTLKPVQFAPCVGEACAAVFSEDGEWYRAEIVESDDPSGKVLVQFVDYGNTELVDSASIQPLQPEHIALPTQAIWCSITTDFTKSYLQSEITSFSVAVENQTFDMEAYLIEGDSVIVKLFNSSGQQVFPRDKEVVEEEEVVSDVNEPVLTAAKTSPSDPSSLIGYEKLPNFNVGDKMAVCVTYIVSPADFHCQLCRNEEQLDTLMAELADYCNSLPPEDNTPFTTGQACAAASSMDGAWYRAEVTEVCEDKAVVFFVDYGNSEEVPLSKIRPLMPGHTHLPAQAVWCSLTSDFSCEFEKNVCIDFDEEATGNVYSMEVLQVEAECLVVRLLDDSGSSLFCNFTKEQSFTQGSTTLQEEKECAGDTLQAETGSSNLQEETGSGNLQEEIGSGNLREETESENLREEAGSGNQLLEVGSKEIEVDGTLSYKPACLPSVGTRLAIQVTHVSSPADFYCQVLDNVDAVEAVQTLLATYDASFVSKITESSLNQPCAALNSQAGVWCRAEIAEITTETTALVQFVDWGNSEEVLMASLKPLAEEHLILPPQALWCSVTSNFEQEFGEDEVGEFVSVVKDQVFELEIRKVVKETAVVTLWDEEGTEVGRMFSDRKSRKSSSEVELERLAEELFPGKEHGKDEQTSNTFKWPLKVGIGDKINVYVSSIDSASSFFCQPLHMAAELDDIMVKMADMLVESSQPMEMSRVEEGVICAGRFSQDDSWYRTVIEQVISSDQVLLRYIDYGNQEVVPVEKLAELPRELLSCRAQLIHCSCVPSKTATTEKMDEAFRESVSEGMQLVIAIMKEISRGKYLVKLYDESDAELDMSVVLQLSQAEESISEEDAGSNATSENDAEVDLLTKALIQDEELRASNGDEEVEDEIESAQDEFQTTITSIPSPPNREKLSLFDKDDSSDSEETSSSTEGPISPSVMPFKLSLGVKEMLQVEVVTVDNPSMIYIQRCDCAAELKTLISDIEQYTSTMVGTESSEGAFYGPDAPPKKGDFVLAKFSSDADWIRAEVLGEYNPVANTCQLFSVDFGNSEDVPLESILFCPKSFLMLPQQAILCCLADVPRRDAWPIEYQHTILRFVSGKVLQAEVVLPSAAGERAVIRLTDVETGSDLSQEIVCQLEEECGNGESTGSSPEQKQEKEMMSHGQENDPSLEQTEVAEPAHEMIVSGSDQVPDTPQEQEPHSSPQQHIAAAEQDAGAPPKQEVSTSVTQGVMSPPEQRVGAPLEQEVSTGPKQNTELPVLQTGEQDMDKLPEEEREDAGLSPPQEVNTPQEFETPPQGVETLPQEVDTSLQEVNTPQEVDTQPQEVDTASLQVDTETESSSSCSSSSLQDFVSASEQEISSPQQEIDVPPEQEGDPPEHEVIENVGTATEQDVGTTEQEVVTPQEQEDDTRLEQTDATPPEQEVLTLTQQTNEEEAAPLPEQEAPVSSNASVDEDDEEGEDREPIGFDPSEYCTSIPSSPALEVGSETEVLLSHVNSPYSFYCQRTSQQDNLEEFMEDLNTFYNDLYYFDFKFTDEPVEGEVVCFQSGEDETWYRGEVVSVHYPDADEPTAKILFIDYGGSEEVELGELCRLAKDFGEEVPFAMECSMVGVVSKSSDGEFSQDCVDYLESYLDTPLKIQVPETSANRVTQVILSTSDNRSLNQAIVNAGFALANADGQFTNPLTPPTGTTPSSVSSSRENVLSTAVPEDDGEKEEGALDVKDPLEGEGQGVDQALYEGDEQEVVPEQLQGAASEGSREPVDEQLLPTVELEEVVPVITKVDPDDGRDKADEVADESDKAAAAGTSESAKLQQVDSFTVAKQLSGAATDVQTEGIEKDNVSVSPSQEVVSSHSSPGGSTSASSLKGSTQAVISAGSPEGSWEVVSPEPLFPSHDNAEDSKHAAVCALNAPSVVLTAKKTSHPKPLGRGFRDDQSVGVAKAQQPSGLSKSLQSSPKMSPQHKAAPSYPLSLGSSPKHLSHTSIAHQPPSLHSLASNCFESLPRYHMGQGGGGYPGFSLSLTTPPTDFSHSGVSSMSLFQYTPVVFNPGDRLKLVFTSADSPEQFTCHLVDSAQSHQMQMEPQECARNETKEELGPGTPVLVQSSSDGQWYRGEVLQQDEAESSGAATCIVTMDSGGIQQVSTSALRPLPVEFVASPPHALRCSLAYVEPVEAALGWTEDAVKDFISIMRSSESFQAVVASVKSDGQVCLQAEIGTGNEDVADKLVAMGHASPRLSKM